MTQDVLGALFGIQQPVANKWIHFLLPILTDSLADIGELPSRGSHPLIGEKNASPIYFHDGTERPINRPKDRESQKKYYSGKKQHTVKNNLIIDVTGKVVLLTDSFAGKTHDKRIADLSGYRVPEHLVSGYWFSRL